MAFPIVLINSATGSDTQASGAGPSTAIFGSTGRTRNTASQTHFGFFGATDDLSGVSTAGDHVVYMGIATAGQAAFKAITAVKNTRQTTTGNITSGAAILSNLGTTTGWTAGDVVKVAGAGAASADLYSTVLSVDSGTQVTLNDNAGTTVVAGAVENPKQVTFSAGVNTGTTDTIWAIGGKRATLTDTTNLSNRLYNNNAATSDAQPGWIMEMQSGHTETSANIVTPIGSGDTTGGPITVRGTSGAVTPPVVTFSNNGAALNPTGGGNYWQWRDFEIKNSNVTKSASVGIVIGATAGHVFVNIKVKDGTNNFWKAMTASSGSAVFIGCEFGNTAAQVIDYTGAGTLVIENCYIHDPASTFQCINITSTGILELQDCFLLSSLCDLLTVTSAPQLFLRGNLFKGGASGKYAINSSGNASTIRRTMIVGNTFDNFASSGAIIITESAANMVAWRGSVIKNNIFSNGTGTSYAVNFAAATAISIASVGFMFLNNDWFSLTAFSNLTLTSDIATTNLNPGYVNAGSNNYGIGANVRAIGFPTNALGNGGSATISYIDLGAAQAQSAGGSFPFVS